jgi:ubiquinone/menaquinone biosynthesis C-methylase UbiE
VLEVGSGDGRSFEHYPSAVEIVLAVEPDPVARAAAEERARSTRAPIELADGVAASLPAGDGSVDAVVMMGVLCSVPDAQEALAEALRVLAPAGELRVWEHVRSRHVPFRWLQHAGDHLFWTRTLGGCRTTRDTEQAIGAAGFRFDWLEHGFHSSSLLTVTSAPYILGIARAPA